MAKLRWNCERDGCFNLKRRPKIEMFDDCFPGNIQMGDIDGLVEIKGYLLFFEWKTQDGPLPKGQQLAYERISKESGKCVMVTYGDAETMAVRGYRLFFHGREYPRIAASLGDVRERLRRWSRWAQQHGKKERA
jgi:hypothetical protein